ncbi:retrovirus-related pol polyprotein from transposon TNT 1-94 [Tanacetum coccineum]
MTFFLGLQVNQSPCGIFINQSNSVLEILKKYGMETCDPTGTPIEIKDKLDLDKSGTLVDGTKYRSMIGAQMYLTSSRTDIVHATCGTVNMGLWQKAGQLVLKETRLLHPLSPAKRICVCLCLLCPSSEDEDTVNGLWLSFQQDSYQL